MLRLILLRGMILSLLFNTIMSHAQTIDHKGGQVVYKIRMYNALTEQYDLTANLPDHRIWYRDSFMIQELSKVYINSTYYRDELSMEMKANRVFEIKIDHYTFIDLRNNTFYDYRHFSDTAVLMKKYTAADTASVRGGWDFFAGRNIMEATQNLRPLSDTVLNGVLYQRQQADKWEPTDTGRTLIVYTAYLRCDNKKSMFYLDRTFSEKMGCSFVRLDHMMIPNHIGTNFELEFVADKLTEAESKVFDAWEKNEKQYPVKN